MWLLVIVVIFLGLAVSIILYNNLVNKKNRILNSFAGIDVLLKKRYDLIPNLVSSVKQYMKHEQGVLAQITELRTRALGGDLSDAETIEVDRQITGALKGLMIAVENYPELKASENFLQLQASLNEVEEQISAARRAYNATVLEYNNAVEMIPTNLMAGLMRYKKKNFFEIAEAEKPSVNVQTMFGN